MRWDWSVACLTPVSKQVESIKHLLWHGNVEEALERLTDLIMDLELIRNHSAPSEKLAAGVAEFETCLNIPPGFRTCSPKISSCAAPMRR